MPKASIQFACINRGCNGNIMDELEVSSPNFNVERMTDGDLVEEHNVCCPVCDTDYEVETVNGLWGITANIDGNDINIDLEPDYDDYEDYLLSYEPANNVVGAFEKSETELLDLLTNSNATPTSVLNRMIYSQLIATMEAYLSDKILMLSTEHDAIKRRLIEKADFIRDKTLKVTDLLLDPEKAEKTFKLGLQKLLYHDLERVEKLYNVALAEPFWPANPDVKIELEKAVLIRHDCVHRNGADITGRIHSFDESVIGTLAKHITDLVEHIEDKAECSIQKIKMAATAQTLSAQN
ncbi:hypothetical protein [Acetobacter oryzifermentans]|nr:hypothetical protein [Acetobacter oryzifermentans]